MNVARDAVIWEPRVPRITASRYLIFNATPNLQTCTLLCLPCLSGFQQCSHASRACNRRAAVPLCCAEHDAEQASAGRNRCATAVAIDRRRCREDLRAVFLDRG